MPEDPTHFAYEDLIDYAAAGYFGSHYEQMLRGLGGGGGDYTVYWPKDSIRVIRGSSYAIARAVACLLRDERTYWMSEPTSRYPADIALVRRELSDASAGEAEARNPRIYVRDRMLSWDISTRGELRTERSFFGRRQGDLEFDFSTLPE